MKTNVAASTLSPETHEGGRAVRQTSELELERAVQNCLLFENTFYEPGLGVAERITELCTQVKPDVITNLALRARNELHLRHVPLWLLVQLCAHSHGSELAVRSDRCYARIAIAGVIRRPDELGELLALYWKDGRKPVPAAMKRGLADAFRRFDEYQLAKWDRQQVVKLRDVMRIVHPKPRDKEQGDLWGRLLKGELATPDTWEVRLSRGDDKAAAFRDLLSERRLGYMALLANLRNISGAGVDRDLVLTALLEGAARSKALPFRFIQAWRHAPAFAPAISTAMIAALQERERLAGTTAIVVDVSYSMQDTMSGKSQATRLDAASGLAVMLANLCEDCRLWTFSYKLAEVPVAKGIELIDGIKRSQPMQGTYLRAAVEKVAAIARGINRIIVITDEQSHDGIPVATFPLAYLVNVAPYKPGLDVSNGWTRISGFSERIVEWIQMEEAPARGMPDDLIVT